MASSIRISARQHGDGGTLRGRLSAGLRSAARATVTVAGIAVAGLLTSGHAGAQSIAAGALLWASQGCGGCHGTPPGLPQRNLANAQSVLDSAITNNAGGFMSTFAGLTGTERASLALYAGSTITGTQSTSVAYNGSVSVSLANISTTSSAPASAVITAVSTVGGVTGGTLGAYNQATPSVTYTHTATNCTNGGFTFRGTGLSGATTSNRTVTITVTAPTAPTISNSMTSIAYNSAMATNIPLSLGAGPVSSLIVGPLSGGAGTLTPSGNTLTYTASASTYVASQTFTVQAVGPCATSAAATITLNVAAPPAPLITSPATASGNGGQAFSYTITASNAPTSFNATGLPAGLMVNTMTGAITGTPTVTGMFTPMISATNITGTTTQALPMTINLVAPVITSGLAVMGTSGSPFTYTITANNLPASFNATGLPTGLMINTMTGVISGTPTVLMGGPVNVMISATNMTGTDTRTLVMTITLNPPTFTSATTASGNVGSPFTFAVTATDFPSSFAAAGLPPGLAINALTGVISGTPTLAGMYPVMLTATNGSGMTNQTLTITIVLLPPVVSSAASATGTTTLPFSYQIAASNAPTMFAATGLPPGLSVNAMTGLISGTPTVLGTYNTMVSATNASGTGSKAVTITISALPPPSTNGAAVIVPFGGTGMVDLSFLVGGAIVSQYRITTPVLNGTVIITGSVATYTPNPGFFGTDSFAFTATGVGGTSNPATVTFTVLTPGAPSTAARAVMVPFNTATAIDLTSSITGVASTVAVSTAPAHGTTTVSGRVVTYRPTSGYFGDDTFSYTATGPGGTSMPAAVSITVGTAAPTVSAVRFMVPINTPTTMDLAPFIGGSAISGVRVMSQPKFGRVAENGTKVVYTPATDFVGDDTFSYMAFGNAGTSTTAVVTVTVLGYPDPTKNPNVGGIVNAQTQAAKRFADTQIGNFQTRMESLHRQKEIADATGAAKPVATQTAERSPAPILVENAGADRNGLKSVSNPQNPGLFSPTKATENTAKPVPLAADAVSLLTTRSVNLASVGTAAGGNAVPSDAVGATNFWTAGSANFGQRGATGNISGSEFTTSGVSFGADRRLSKTLVLGAGLGFARDRTDIGSDGSQSKARGFSVVGYGSYQPGANLFVDGLLGFGSLDFTTRRYIVPNNSFANGDRDGRQFFGSIAAGYEKRDAGVLLSPYARLDYSSDRLKQGSESSGGQYALSYASQTSNSLQGVLGFRAETVHKTEYGWASPRLRAEYRHEFQNAGSGSVSYLNLTGSPNFPVLGSTVVRNALVVGVGSEFQFKRGLSVGLDYQVTHAFNKDSSQGLRLTITQPLDGRGNPLLLDAIPVTFGKPQDIQLDAGYMFDDNVTRGKERQDKRSDRVYSVNASKGFLFTFNDNTRSMVTYSLGGEKFDTFKGLDRAMAGIEADVKYRTSADFDALTYAVFAQVTAEQFQSILRRGYRASVGFSARQQITDRIGLFGAVTHNQRWAKSGVFDNRFNALRLNADYAWNTNDTVYLTGEFRKGQFVSTGLDSLENVNIAEVFVDDDAYPGTNFTSYRVQGNTVISTLGYNMGFGPRHSLDLSWRRAQSTPDNRPSFATSPRSYVANQYSVVYLIRF